MWVRTVVILLLTGAFCVGTVTANDLSSLRDMAREASDRGNYGEAERYNRLAVAAAESSGSPDQFAEALGNLCGILLARGQYDESKRLCLQSLDILRKTGTKQHLPIVLNNLGVLSTYAGDFAKSESYLKESSRVAQELNPEDPYIARVLNNLGALYYTTGDSGNAEKAFKEAIAIVEKKFGQDHADLAAILANLGGVYVVRKKWDRAAATLERALVLLQDSTGSIDSDLAGVLQNMGNMHYERRNFAQAEEAFRKAHALRLGVFGSAHPAVALSAVSLATTLAATGHYGEAEVLYTTALQIYEKTRGLRSREVAATLEGMAAMLRKTEREESAGEFEARAQSIRFELKNTVRVGQEVRHR